MNPLRKAVRDYLKLRRGLGFKLAVTEIRLGQFLEFLRAKKTSRITTKLALEFATQGAHWTACTKARRLAVVRGFARYHCVNDRATEIPPLGLLAAPFGLLTVSGMRIGEVLNLRPDDINWIEGILTIRNTKFGKSRLVPLHASTLKALRTFVRHRDCFFSQLRPCPQPSHFFVTSRGTRLYFSQVYRVFITISRQIGLRAPDARRGPRLHHLRHRFAIETLLQWYRAGEKVDRLLPVLSTYLGHTDVTGSYWYLRCTPELMVAAGDLLERRWKGIQ